MMLVQLEVSMYKNRQRSIIISLVKAQLYMDQGPPCKPDTLKLIEEKVGKSLEDMGTGKKFLNRTGMSYA